MSHFRGLRAFFVATAVSGLLAITAASASADAIDFNFSGGTLDGVASLGTSPTGSTAAIDSGDYIEDTSDAITGVSFTKSGLTVVATGYGDAGAKLYGDTQPKKGGLGVNDNDQNDGAGAGSDDNIQTGESVKVEFDFLVQLNEGWFFDENHKTVFGGKAVAGTVSRQFGVKVDGGAMQYFDYDHGGSGLVDLGNLEGQTFEFFNLNSGYAGHYGADFYVSMLSATIVPEPSTIVLMGAAGLGVIFMGRRRRKLAIDEATA